jgi:hypothetical protein
MGGVAHSGALPGFAPRISGTTPLWKFSVYLWSRLNTTSSKGMAIKARGSQPTTKTTPTKTAVSMSKSSIG